jgi:predicted phage-related endonuclease
MNAHNKMVADSANRRSFIGGSDARIIMGEDEAALVRLWREKRGEVEPEDLADIVQQTVPQSVQDAAAARPGSSEVRQYPALPRLRPQSVGCTPSEVCASPRNGAQGQR